MHYLSQRTTKISQDLHAVTDDRKKMGNFTVNVSELVTNPSIKTSKKKILVQF